MEEDLVRWRRKGDYFNFRGFKIFYIKEGTGPVLTIFHGYPYSSFDFEKVWDELAKNFTVIVLDMLGMGFSDKPKMHKYCFEEMADLYDSLFKELEVTATHILAHDLGDNVVQELLARNQEGPHTVTINSIAFLNGGLFSDVFRPGFIQVLLSKSPNLAGRFISWIISRKMVGRFTAEVFGAATKPSVRLLKNFWDVLNYNDGKSTVYLIGKLIFEKDKHQQRWIKAMQQSDVRMCFINGLADPNAGMQMAARYLQVIPDADVRLLDDKIGHWPQIEAPEQLLKIYSVFLEEVQY